MGQNGSSPVNEGGGADDSSRASSPLGDDTAYDGLPSHDTAAIADFQVNFSQRADGLPTVFSPTRPTHPAPSSEDLEAIARSLKPAPDSPELTKSKKKKHRKSKEKTQTIGHNQEQQSSAAVPAEGGDEPQAIPDVESVLTAAPEIANETSMASPESTTSRKKKKSKADKASETRLDLNEDPIAGSDEEIVIPSSDKPRRRKSRHDDDGSSRKFRKKDSIPTVTEMDASAIEDVNEEPRASAVESTQVVASNFIQQPRDAVPYEVGEEYSSPLATRKERRARFAPTISASGALAQVVGAEGAQGQSAKALMPSQIKNGETKARPTVPSVDAMDVDVIDPRLNDNLTASAANDGMGQPSDYPGGLATHQQEDATMEDETPLPQLSQPNGAGHTASGRADVMSSVEEDALMALASTMPEPGTDDERSNSNRSAAEDEETRRFNMFATSNGNESDADELSTARSGNGRQTGQQRGGKARASAKEKRTRPDISNLLSEEPSPSNDDPAPNPSTAYPPPPETSIHATPRSTRTYTRQAKPSFLEREEEETAEAFAELPSNAVAATPKTTKGKAKRRLPVDVSDAEDGSPAKRQKSNAASGTKAAKATKAAKDPNAPRKPPGRKKAPETAIRSSTGFLSGVFTKTEVSQVERAVEAFRSDHDLPQVEVNAMIQQNPKDPNIKDNSLHEELWSRIMNACPTRPRQKLLNWCRQKFHNFVARATWTPEQDAELTEMIKIHGTKWNVIGQLINRHQKDVRDRYRNYLIAGDNRRNSTWDPKEEKEFLEIVGEVLSIFQDERRRNPDSDMFKSGKTNEELVDWNVVAERMKHGRTRLQCQEKWRRMREGNKINETVLATLVEPDQRWRLKRARHEIASMSHADMYHIVLAIPNVDGGVKEDIRINWKAILESQRKKYHRYTAMLLWSRLRKLVPGQENMNVQQCAKELIRMYQSDGGTFAMPSDNAFNKEEEEKLLADIPPPRKRGPGKPKAGKGKASDRGRASSRSKEFVDESDSDGDDQEADEGDSSRADYSETSPAPEAASVEHGQTRDDDEGSVEVSNDAGHDGRGGSVELGLDAAVYDEVVSPKPAHKSAKSKSKSKAAKEKEVTPPPPASPVKQKKRFSGEMTSGFTPRKSSAAEAAESAPASTAPAAGSTSTSRKRARADAGSAGDVANGSAPEARKSKRARRAAAPVEHAPASSDDEMEDIPARLPVAEM